MAGVTQTVGWPLTGMPALRSRAVSSVATKRGGSLTRLPLLVRSSFRQRAERGPQSSVSLGFHELTTRALSK